MTQDPQWKLVWSDEFEGGELDPAKWDTDLGNGFFDYRVNAWVPGWGNEELQYYTREPENVRVRDGHLSIRALKEPLLGCGYTSGRVKTRRRDGTPLFNQRYGKFEFRAKVPHGKGIWPAIWLLPQDDVYGAWAASGEIDVMEILGDRPQEYLASVHFGSTFPKRTLVTHKHPFPNGGSVADWHVYAVEWEPGEIRWSVDGSNWARQDFWWSCSALRNGQGIEARRASDLNPWPAPFDQAFYIVMNVAVGGNFSGLPNAETAFPAELVVDYVRVYERAGGYAEPRPRGTGRLPFERRPARKKAVPKREKPARRHTR